ncbi:hypothetical protein [Rhizohabitans arisaemae]|uniref:hypothetical protein n=1 Tax=Rhizohabitans arisaemae TaxID=2720610 RepID=UPI0024B1BB83|nr:hypothetical protein [Rhizohabitans arisaemae]
MGVRVGMFGKVLMVGALTAAALTAGPAGAANAAPYTPQAICGPGFAVVDDGVRAVRSVFNGEVFGYVYLLYNRASGYNCVTTIKSKYVGVPSKVTANLLIQNGAGELDSKEYKYYANVAAYARGRCVAFWGGIHSPGSTVWGEGSRGYGNCGT